MILIVPRRLERLHVQRAWRRYPETEYIEAIFGKRIKHDRFDVALYYEFTHLSGRGWCYYEDEMTDWLREEASDLGLEYLGTIHSHNGLNTCSHFSETDIRTHIRNDDIVSAVTYLYRSAGRRHSEVNYGTPWQPVTVAYI